MVFQLTTNIGEQMKKEKQYPKDNREGVPTLVYQWGPTLARMEIDEALKMILIDEYENNKKNKQLDYRKNLAGQLQHETGYTSDSKKKVLPHLDKYFKIYEEARKRYFNRPDDKPRDYILTSLWINHQKQHEFNPPHDHDGKLSFVIYLKVPEMLRIENEASKDKSCGPGGIQFIYGEGGGRDSINFVSHFPKEGEIFIFPAWLKHWVCPFKSDCTRISVSGNVYDVTATKALVKNKNYYEVKR